MKIRYFKVWRDLSTDYVKNFMLVLAIAIGVFGIGAILGGYSVVKREMTVNYMSTSPASATIEVEEDISASLVDSVKQLPGIKEAERHATVLARMKVDDKWYPLLLFVKDDFKNLRTNKFNFISGVEVPPEGTMLAERTALKMMEANEGDKITIKLPHGQEKIIKLSGTVHDPGLAPAWQEQAGYGYMSMSTLHSIGGEHGFDQLRIIVAEQGHSYQHIQGQANNIARWLEQKGYTIHEIQIPPPNKHPHQGQMNTVMFIFIIFSFLILILGSILVATSMATLMVKQVRQIGVMKTIGATTTQIAGLYLSMMVILCAAALVLGIPLGRIAAGVLYSQISHLLNLELTDDTIPYWVPAVQVAAGIVIPLVAAAFPVGYGSRISVRNAMDNYGVSQKHQQGLSWSTSLGKIFRFGEMFMLSLRNVFRQRSRLVMTLGLLAAGGAMFMTALNVSSAWENNLQKIYLQRSYDLDVKLSQAIKTEGIVQKLQNIDGVKIVEGWYSSPTAFAKDAEYEVSHTYPDKGHGSFTIQGLPLPTQLLRPVIKEGRWLNPGANNEVVLNQLARGNIKLGDNIRLFVNEKISTWEVVGFTEDVGTPGTAYVNLATLTGYGIEPRSANVLRIAFAQRDRAFTSAKTKQVETLLSQENISVSSSTPVWILHNAIAAHMKVLVNSLMAMAILMAFVGTLGLTSTISMNVLERTREIGVMRAIGATPAKIRRLIAGEGLTIGAISIIVSVVLSLVLSAYLGRLIGNMSFRTPLALTVSLIGLVSWVAIILFGSYIATVLPARRANKITTREALAYE
ncbi:MAG: ABC transporter permease [Bacteroidota bacterium]